MKLTAQCSEKFWNNKKIRPDIIGEYKNNDIQQKQKFIIDTKWKCPNDGNPGDDDLKQMFTYNVHFGAYSSILLYPASEKADQKHGIFQKSKALLPSYSNHSCSTYYINLFESDGKLNINAGEDLLNKLID